MDIEFHWTDESEAHIARHGVAPYEVEEARERPTYVYQGRNGVQVLLGVTYAGRHLTIVLAESMADTNAMYVVTSREMTLSEKRIFKRKAK
jgi:hypothetical protein